MRCILNFLEPKLRQNESRPGARWGSLQRSPDLIAKLPGRERSGEGKREEQKGIKKGEKRRRKGDWAKGQTASLEMIFFSPGLRDFFHRLLKQPALLVYKTVLFWRNYVTVLLDLGIRCTRVISLAVQYAIFRDRKAKSQVREPPISYGSLAANDEFARVVLLTANWHKPVAYCTPPPADAN